MIAVDMAHHSGKSKNVNITNEVRLMGKAVQSNTLVGGYAPFGQLQMRLQGD